MLRNKSSILKECLGGNKGCLEDDGSQRFTTEDCYTVMRVPFHSETVVVVVVEEEEEQGRETRDAGTSKIN